MNKTRLLKLATFLEELPTERFNYCHWVGRDWKGKVDLSCGTTACALGWATAIPEFQEAGLKLVPSQPFEQKYAPFAVAYNEDLAERLLGSFNRSITSAQKFFAISRDEAVFLFTPSVQSGAFDWPSPPDYATPDMVAAHIRDFVKAIENG